MRLQYLIIPLLLFSAACGSRSMNAGLAKDVIVRLPAGPLEKEDLDVQKVTQISATEAIAETELKTAFRIEKVRNNWVVREVKLGHGQWEKIDNLTRTLETIKLEETRAMLERIAEAVQKYREARGSLPAFNDYITLSDMLSPAYLTPLIRLDAWRRPLGVRHIDSNTSSVLSAGVDGRFGTADDIIRTIPR